jgi:gluconolactonase
MTHYTIQLIAASAVLAGISTLGADEAQPQAPFDIKDAAAFALCVESSATVTQLASGLGFTEGCTWVGQGAEGKLIFSDIPANELKEWTATGGLKTFRTPSGNANGNTTDLESRLITAEHTGRRISRQEKDGSVVTVVDRFEGKRFSSPNDVTVKSDGTIWFTDPPYGLGKDGVKETEGDHVYRHDPKSGKTTRVAMDQERPNGVAFSPDEKTLYVADSGKPHNIWSYTVADDGSLRGGKVFCTIDKGGPDGIRVDSDGRLWSSAGDGVHIFSAKGDLIGKIRCPESPANVCFGGADGKTLFMTARKGLYSIPVKAKSAAR